MTEKIKGENVSEKKESRHFIYIIQCTDGTLYTGWTTNLESRMEAHNNGTGAKYTRGRGPVQLLYSESFAGKGEALKREHEIKKLTREKKLALIGAKSQDQQKKGS